MTASASGLIRFHIPFFNLVIFCVDDGVILWLKIKNSIAATTTTLKVFDHFGANDLSTQILKRILICIGGHKSLIQYSTN